MKSRIFFLTSLLTLFFALPVMADKDDDVDPTYEIVQTGTGTPGTCLVQVTCYSKKGKVSDEKFKQNAVHGVIFKGAPAIATGTRLPALRPLVSSPQVEQEKGDYFKEFFDTQYVNYATIVPGSYSRMKTAKKGYRVSCTLQVSRDELRKALERADIVKGLSSGF